MARIRTVKPEFFTSESVLSVTPLARLFFIGLWCEADREGRLKWKPKTLKFRYLPADNVNIEKLTSELASEGMILIYQDDGQEFCWIPGFQNHQVINNRETKSNINPHPLDSGDGKQPAKIPQKTRELMFSKWSSCCKCGSIDDLTIDHILPQSCGGTHEEFNLRVMCRSCNSKRPVQGEGLAEDLKSDGYSMDELKKLNACRRVPTRESGRKEGREGRERKGMSRFTPPTQEDVFSYMKERGVNSTQEAEKFFDYYQSKGWVVGKSKMKDWKASVRNWTKNTYTTSNNEPPNKPREFTQ